jgi:hypothetical protein
VPPGPTRPRRAVTMPFKCDHARASHGHARASHECVIMPGPVMNTNLSDLNNDILNVIGDYVKKDNLKKALIKKNKY